MKSKLLLLGGVGLCAVAMVACNGDHDYIPPVVEKQSLDTAQVLALAQTTSETSEPIPVNNGGVTLTDTSETSAPIAVDAM